ncbi:MAG TPA: nitrite reductase small subunit NirD [Thioploca sp.]|nr:nitrite reductase small subunit NirD [Thioploca sp.]
MNIGKLNDIPVLGSRVVQTERGEIAIFRTSDDAIFAIANNCPHKEGPLADGIIHGHKVTCPLHNWQINLENGEAIAPDQGCAESFKIEVDTDGNLLLNI